MDLCNKRKTQLVHKTPQLIINIMIITTITQKKTRKIGAISCSENCIAWWRDGTQCIGMLSLSKLFFYFILFCPSLYILLEVSGPEGAHYIWNLTQEGANTPHRFCHIMTPCCCGTVHHVGCGCWCE